MTNVLLFFMMIARDGKKNNGKTKEVKVKEIVILVELN
jgi:hypothetical protein